MPCRFYSFLWGLARKDFIQKSSKGRGFIGELLTTLNLYDVSRQHLNSLFYFFRKLIQINQISTPWQLVKQQQQKIGNRCINYEVEYQNCESMKFIGCFMIIYNNSNIHYLSWTLLLDVGTWLIINWFRIQSQKILPIMQYERKCWKEWSGEPVNFILRICMLESCRGEVAVTLFKMAINP